MSQAFSQIPGQPFNTFILANKNKSFYIQSILITILALHFYVKNLQKFGRLRQMRDSFLHVFMILHHPLK
jgi:hypothetical protein